ncbi:glycosyltransferase family 2 protein [Candidatus Parcubacteria bacterium]|nr:glycosyltransferase family 2 protein [Patescibacteria group bacterium]MCG2699675.1 glycosyltransferase family 2 protein [Candidatus Parcubacteria bacterium]
MKLSIIIPIYNEEESIFKLYQKLKEVLSILDAQYEIIAVNDGSTDNSYQALKEISQNDNAFKVINFRKNFGQTAAISAGIDMSKGEIIVPIDADLENKPEDIPNLLEKLDEGYDVVSGWRKHRWEESFFTRRLTSLIANLLISKIVGLKLHDYGCTMKAYRRDVIKDIKFYGDMHRFIPAYAMWYGAKIVEIPIAYEPRQYGKSKYGIGRTFRVLLDILTIRFLTDYLNRPMHFFGRIGFWLFLFSFLSGFLALYLRFFFGVSLILTPLPLLTAFLVIIGIQFILMGLLAEILIRTYYESQKKSVYLIKEKINF